MAKTEIERVNEAEMKRRGAVKVDDGTIDKVVKKVNDYQNPNMPGYIPQPFPVEVIGNRIIVLVLPKIENRTKSGIILIDSDSTNDTAQGIPEPGKECRVQVVATPKKGEGMIKGVKAKDILFVNSYANTFIKVNGYNYLICTEHDIYGKEVGRTDLPKL